MATAVGSEDERVPPGLTEDIIGQKERDEISEAEELDGPIDWVVEQPALRRLYEQVLQTVDRDKQQAIFQQMERHARDQAYCPSCTTPFSSTPSTRACSSCRMWRVSTSPKPPSRINTGRSGRTQGDFTGSIIA